VSQLAPVARVILCLLLRYRLEYALIWPVIKGLGLLPRPAARAVAQALGWLLWLITPRLRRVAHRNLMLAMPELSAAERNRIVRGVYRSLARQIAEVALLPRLTPANISEVVTYDGFENYANAIAQGRGVLFLTGHLGAWELSAFAHALCGHPLYILIRALDNPLLNGLVNHYRTMSGNKIIEKRDFLRGILAALKENQAVGILADQNSSMTEGVMVDFFGTPACTAAGLARIALKTGATVVPGFTLWDGDKYRLRFEPAVKLVSTGDADADAVANTQLFTKVIEDFVRRYPDQWLWIHRRWKTRAPGQPEIY
jgi:KDO2-lipid IV(A) lauroyltransferase